MNHYQFTVIIILVLCTVLTLPGLAQYEEVPPQHLNEYGAGITLAMSGFGLGGYYRKALPDFFHVGASIDFFMMRDENEFTYYDSFGVPRQFNKFNRLFIIPLSVEIKRRLFQNSIEESFRPHVIALGGVTVGMNFPRENEVERSQLPPEEQERLPQNDEYRVSFNIGLGLGIDFTSNESYYVSIRPQFRLIYFPEPIAGDSNHSTFEIRLELGKRK
jgi:hypothetical protein